MEAYIVMITMEVVRNGRAIRISWWTGCDVCNKEKQKIKLQVMLEKKKMEISNQVTSH